ncbi:hypothetical protein HDU83_005640 [Entophlyctis luteolus]|nr:hypothetical protein HDU83_005640 [Entophlyctis luteolus]
MGSLPRTSVKNATWFLVALLSNNFRRRRIPKAIMPAVMTANAAPTTQAIIVVNREEEVAVVEEKEKEGEEEEEEEEGEDVEAAAVVGDAGSVSAGSTIWCKAVVVDPGAATVACGTVSEVACWDGFCTSASVSVPYADHDKLFAEMPPQLPCCLQ